MAVVASDAAATPVAFRRGPDALFDFDNAITVAGDGRFDLASVGPPAGVPVVARFTSKASHQDVAVDRLQSEFCQAFRAKIGGGQNQ